MTRGRCPPQGTFTATTSDGAGTVGLNPRDTILYLLDLSLPAMLPEVGERAAEREMRQHLPTHTGP